ncbi:PREDICTED: uncharacterized protein LOC104699980 [Camelina sativa]|uniref:Uncharacterized protein LOC104699980 n=1 Tax=Camelina sativa TaxID=90675 RepID=A0ABM1Q856_CAMSA|nr:PREDICTED: uncharacterized protein LOC104699980 [Camelina sativa]
MGLNESYEQARRHILMLKPIPTIEEAFNMVTQDERQITIKPLTRIDNVAFQSSALVSYDGDQTYVAAYNTRRPTQKPVCTHCGRLGHTIQKCYKLHGFPPGYKTNTGYKGNSQSQSTFQPRMQTPQFQPRMSQNQPRMQMQMAPYDPIQKANVIANVYTEQPSNSLVSQSASTGFDGNSFSTPVFTPQQLKQLFPHTILKYKLKSLLLLLMLQLLLIMVLWHKLLLLELSRGLMIGRGRLHNNLYILETESKTLSPSFLAVCSFTTRK